MEIHMYGDGAKSSSGAAGLGGVSGGVTPAARASPPDWPRRGGGRVPWPISNGIGSRNTQG